MSHGPQLFFDTATFEGLALTATVRWSVFVFLAWQL